MLSTIHNCISKHRIKNLRYLKRPDQNKRTLSSQVVGVNLAPNVDFLNYMTPYLTGSIPPNSTEIA